MGKKIALALTGLLLMITASFAPVANAPWPPCVESNTYITMGVQKEITVALKYGPLTFVLKGPFATRAPWLSPYGGMEQICFSPEIDPDGPGPLPPCVVFINVTWGTPLVHEIYSPTVGGVVGMPWLRIVEQPLPGFGWIYTVNGIADVDVILFNNKTGNYWGSAAGIGSSPMAGTFAYDGLMVPFPSPGPDGLPGFLPTSDDGFGNGVPDPKGSSVLYLPEIFMVYGYNATTGMWQLLLGAPLMTVMTTEWAFDHVVEPTSYLYCVNSTKRGSPWEFLASCLPWTDPSSHKVVKYAAAFSLMDFLLDPGPPRIALDILCDKEEKKVRADCAALVPDINCDNVVNIIDIVIAAMSFGKHDEGLGPDGLPNTADDWPVASPGYDARGDLNGDGIVNIVDLVLIAIRFGCAITPQCVVCS